MTTRIHILQHVPFEGAGSMAGDFEARACHLDSTHWYRGDRAPALDSFDWLVVMGGPMGVYDEEEYPWLAEEKTLIREAINAGKVVLGICLGAQLIASVTGAQVRRNPHKEIGWFPVERQPEADQSPLKGVLPERMEVFHWHGDTFDLPPGALLLASSQACRNQAFSLGDRVFGFQFHLETTPALARTLVENCSDELDGSAFVQTADKIVGAPEQFARINAIMHKILTVLFAGVS